MSRVRGLVVAAIAAGALLALPGRAAAGEQCLYQGVQATASVEHASRSLLCLTNLYRLRSGVPVLKSDTRLLAAATAHSDDMVRRGYFDHVSPEGTTPSARALAAGYPGGAGENIGADSRGTPLDLFNGFKSSPGHNANMLTPGYVAAGFGIDDRAAIGGPGGIAGITGTEMFGLVSANSASTGFDLYASSDKCAKAKLASFGILAKPKKKRSARLRRKLRRLNRRIAKICKPPA